MIRFFFCIFWLIAAFKIKNNRPKRLPSSPWLYFCALKARFCAQKESSLSAAKTIMYHSCDVEKCDDTSATMAERGGGGKDGGKDERIAWPERQMMLDTRIIHIYRAFLYTTFPRILAALQWWTCFDRRRFDFTLQCRQSYAPYRLHRRLLRTYTTN